MTNRKAACALHVELQGMLAAHKASRMLERDADIVGQPGVLAGA